jgi:hypothetical protein
VTRARQRWLLGHLVMLLACDDDLPSAPVSDAVLTYVVLAKDSVLAADSVVSGLVATAGTPFQASYRHIEEFGMKRTRDGAPFAWQIRDLTGQPITIPANSGALPISGNITLARAKSAGQLGRDSLEYGERYSLHIVTEGIVVEGTVQVPGQPRPVHVVLDNQEIVAWPRVSGAGGYAIQVDTDRIPQIALSDTQYVVRRDRPPGDIPTTPRAVVRALDSNLVRLISDASTRSAGVRGSYGVVGAISVGVVSLGAAPP